MKTCADCQFWRTDDPVHTWAAPCDLEIIAKPEAWQSCAHFLDRERATGEAQAQSECRGDIPQQMTGGALYGMWKQYQQGLKP